MSSARPQRASRTAFLCLATSLACGCGSSTDAARATASDPAPDCTAPDTVTATSLADYVGALTHSWTYEPLSLEQLNALTRATRDLEAGDPAGSRSAAAELGYELVPLAVAGRCEWLLAPGATAPAGQALLVFDPEWRRDLVVEAPHAHEDHHTDLEAALVFTALEAKALVVSGAHRCAVHDFSGCLPSGQCDAVNQIPALSDPSHSFFNAVSAMHLAFRDTDGAILQLHTNSHADVNGEALVSNGTRYVIPGTPADAFFAALTAPDADVRWCNDPAGAPSGAFCGETNTQSLASNGAADACGGHPSPAGGAEAHRFIHLEQSNERLCLPDAPPQTPPCVDTVDAWSSRLALALESVVPVR